MKILQKLIEFVPAFDRKSEDKGIGALHIKFLLRGPEGAVQFALNTGWYSPHIEYYREPLPTDLRYHSPVLQYETQTVISESCPYIHNQPCYYDGSTLAAEDVFKLLVVDGEHAVWRRLLQYYNNIFDTEHMADNWDDTILSISPKENYDPC